MLVIADGLRELAANFDFRCMLWQWQSLNQHFIYANANESHRHYQSVQTLDHSVNYVVLYSYDAYLGYRLLLGTMRQREKLLIIIQKGKSFHQLDERIHSLCLIFSIFRVCWFSCFLLLIFRCC